MSRFRELSDSVSWERRWRVCSRMRMSEGERDVMVAEGGGLRSVDANGIKISPGAPLLYI